MFDMQILIVGLSSNCYFLLKIKAILTYKPSTSKSKFSFILTNENGSARLSITSSGFLFNQVTYQTNGDWYDPNTTSFL